MSWFDTSGFANLAKSALKEAQKTIDKALDIKEDDARLAQTPRDEQQNFFSTWGIKSIVADGESNDTQGEQEVGTWGSFTGSFFENPKKDEKSLRRITERSESLAETSEGTLWTTEESSKDRRVLSSASLPEGLAQSGISSEQKQDNDSSLSNKVVAPKKIGASQDSLQERGVRTELSEEKRRYSAGEVEGTEKKRKSEVVCINSDNVGASVDNGARLIGRRRKNEERREPSANRALNRVSIVSSESDKKSSESVEILGSQSSTNTDCTTTPDSEVSTSASIVTSQTPVDAKRNSESVEILPDSSVTSPSSIDFLRDSKTDSDSSPFLSPVEPPISTSESEIEKFCDSSDVSPYVSPGEQDAKNDSLATLMDVTRATMHDSLYATKGEIDKSSPESVEVITDVDEIEEVSQAEDSYASASESTIMTIMEATYQQVEHCNKARLELTEHRTYDTCPDNGRFDVSTVAPVPSGISLNTSLDSLKEKHNLHLPLEPITTQPIRKGEYRVERVTRISEGSSTADQIKDSTIEPPDDETLPTENARIKQQSDIPDYPEQYLMLTDSSCEGTLIESSSEDNVIVLKGNESKASRETPALTSSSYVKNMLADAMVEKGEIQLDPPARENSPISSERCDCGYTLLSFIYLFVDEIIPFTVYTFQT